MPLGLSTKAVRCGGVSLEGGLARNTDFQATGREGVFWPEEHET